MKRTISSMLLNFLIGLSLKRKLSFSRNFIFNIFVLFYDFYLQRKPGPFNHTTPDMKTPIGHVRCRVPSRTRTRCHLRVLVDPADNSDNKTRCSDGAFAHASYRYRVSLSVPSERSTKTPYSSVLCTNPHSNLQLQIAIAAQS